MIFKTAIRILVISNHNSFRVLFDKIASIILFEKYIQILALEMANPGNQHCETVPHQQLGSISDQTDF